MSKRTGEGASSRNLRGLTLRSSEVVFSRLVNSMMTSTSCNLNNLFKVLLLHLCFPMCTMFLQLALLNEDKIHQLCVYIYMCLCGEKRGEEREREGPQVVGR